MCQRHPRGSSACMLSCIQSYQYISYLREEWRLVNTVTYQVNETKHLHASHLSERFSFIKCQIWTLAQRKEDGWRDLLCLTWPTPPQLCVAVWSLNGRVNNRMCGRQMCRQKRSGDDYLSGSYRKHNYSCVTSQGFPFFFPALLMRNGRRFPQGWVLRGSRGSSWLFPSPLAIFKRSLKQIYGD